MGFLRNIRIIERTGVNMSFYPYDPSSSKLKTNTAFVAHSLTNVEVSQNITNPSYLAPITMIKARGIGIFNGADGSLINNTGSLLTMIGTISFNPDKGSGGAVGLEIISERSNDGGLTWFGNLESRRSVEISNSGESFGTKLSIVQDWAPLQLLRFRVWVSQGELTLVSTPTVVLGEEYTSPSIVWHLSAI